MIHSCNIHCHTVEIQKAELLGIDDKGRWMPFAFHIGIVISVKLTSDDPEALVNGCTTIFTEQGDTYIIDTPYEEFHEIFVNYNTDQDLPRKKKDNDDLEF